MNILKIAVWFIVLVVLIGSGIETDSAIVAMLAAGLVMIVVYAIASYESTKFEEEMKAQEEKSDFVNNEKFTL
nr:MAG TPA: VIT family protein [Caudoviricetes sp.]